MISLSKLCSVSEEGVRFSAPHASGHEILLRPEDSIRTQNAIGSNIAMMLDDVVPSTLTGPRVEEAMLRTIRWLDRAIAANERPDQAIFAIVQGGLDQDLRRQCAEEMAKRRESLGGFAIGGLSGGEEKDIFWRSVKTSAAFLPRDMPRYCMGVGYAEDMAVCIALGVDMFDCVFPTRTARFGTALTWNGNDGMCSAWRDSQEPIDRECQCWTCRNMSRAALFHIRETSVCGQLLSLHNVEFQNALTGYFREGIKKGLLAQYERNFLRRRYPNGDVPLWIINALSSEGIKVP
jgi:queuine tRNA-ribosyltransferase